MAKVCRCAYDGVLKGMRMGMGRFSLEGREWRIHGLLYGYDLVLCGGGPEGDGRAVCRGV